MEDEPYYSQIIYTLVPAIHVEPDQVIPCPCGQPLGECEHIRIKSRSFYVSVGYPLMSDANILNQ